MNIIILSGGSGKRLWPLSNDARSKQFLKLLKGPDGNYESMIQRVVRQLEEAEIKPNIVIATGVSQVEAIRLQLGDMADIVTEPERRDTFPAILLSASYLFYKKGVKAEEPIIVLPIDPYAELEYFKTLKIMEQEIQKKAADMILMGIHPTYPSEKYGYIVPDTRTSLDQKGSAIRVKRFQEKPNLENARQLIDEGAYWNGGVFGFQLNYLLEIARQYTPADSFEEMLADYKSLKKNSFDYEVVEKASSVAMVPYDGVWKDLGTWNTIAEEMEDSYVGQVIAGEGTRDTTVINETRIPLVVLGSSNQVIVASQDGILVTDKQKSSQLKPYVEHLNSIPMCEELGWGEYRVVDYETYHENSSSLAKHMTVQYGKCVEYPCLKEQTKIWIILNGSGKIVLDGRIYEAERGDTVSILPGQRHSIYAKTGLDILEVQLEKA